MRRNHRVDRPDDYSQAEIPISRSCQAFTLTLTHTGRMPAAAMGHNWVLSKSDDLQAIATDGISAGAANRRMQLRLKARAVEQLRSALSAYPSIGARD